MAKKITINGEMARKGEMKNTAIILIAWAWIGMTASSSTSAVAERAVIQVRVWNWAGNETQIAIFSSGFVFQHLDNSIDFERSEYLFHQIDSKRVEALVNMTKDIDFLGLPDMIEPETYVTDEVGYEIKVRLGSEWKRVMAMGLERAQNPELARRFKTLWHAIVSIAPVPEPFINPFIP